METIKSRVDHLILYSTMTTLFFMPLSEGLKAAGFFLMVIFFLVGLFVNKREANTYSSSPEHPLRRIRANIWIPPLAWGLLAFVGVAFFSAVFSEFPGRALRGALDALRNTLVFLIIANTVHSPEKLKSIVLVLMGGIFIGDVVAIYQFFPERITLNMLSLGDKNSTGQVLSFSLALILGLFFSGKKDLLPKILSIPFLLVTGVTLGLTYARTFWVAVIGVVFLIGILQRAKKVLIFLLVFTGLVFLGISFDPEFKKKVVSLDDPLSDPNMVERYKIWKQAIEIGKDHPVLGVGLKTYAYRDMGEKYNLISPTHSHNLFIHVFAELGLVGLVAFLIWLWFYGQALINMRPPPDSGFYHGFWLGGVGCFIVLLVGGIAHPMLGSESSLTLMTVLGLMFAGFRFEFPDSKHILKNTYSVVPSKNVLKQSEIIDFSLRSKRQGERIEMTNCFMPCPPNVIHSTLLLFRTLSRSKGGSF